MTATPVIAAEPERHEVLHLVGTDDGAENVTKPPPGREHNTIPA